MGISRITPLSIEYNEQNGFELVFLFMDFWLFDKWWIHGALFGLYFSTDFILIDIMFFEVFYKRKNNPT